MASALVSMSTTFHLIFIIPLERHHHTNPSIIQAGSPRGYHEKMLSPRTHLILHQSTAASTWWCGPRPRLGWVEMAVGLSEGPSYPGHSPFIFLLCCPLNDRRRAAHSIFKIGRLFSLFLLSCLTLALLRLLILLLLMSGNVHPNPGPIFPCSVCAGNVTWRGKSVQCCACSKWVHLRCSQLSLSNFRALGSSHSWSCPPLP